MNKIEELKAALAASTPGKWAVGDLDKNGQRIVRSEHIELFTGWHHCVGSIEKDMEANAHFIALAHNLMPALLEAVDAMHEVLRISDRKHEAWDRCYTALEELKSFNLSGYTPARIAWELERTAVGDGYYGNALRVAKDIECVTDTDRALLDRYAIGRNSGTDHVALQDLALRIDAIAKLNGGMK